MVNLNTIALASTNRTEYGAMLNLDIPSVPAAQLFDTSSSALILHVPVSLAKLKHHYGHHIYIPLCLIGALLGIGGMVQMKRALMLGKGNYFSYQWVSGFSLLCICQCLTCAGESMGPQAIAVAISTTTFVTFSQLAGPLLLRESLAWRSVVKTVFIMLSLIVVVALGPQPVQSIALTGSPAKWGLIGAVMVFATGASFFIEATKSSALPTWSEAGREADCDAGSRPPTSTSQQRGSALCLLLCSCMITWLSKVMMKVVLAEGGLISKGPDNYFLAWLLIALSLVYAVFSTHMLNNAMIRWSLSQIEPIFATNMIILMTLSGHFILGDLGHVSADSAPKLVILLSSVSVLFITLCFCIKDAS